MRAGARGERRVLGGHRLPRAVRQAAHQRVEDAVGEQIHQRLGLGHDRQRDRTRIDARQRAPPPGGRHARARRQHRELEAGVPERKPRELLARVAARAQHRDDAW